MNTQGLLVSSKYIDFMLVQRFAPASAVILTGRKVSVVLKSKESLKSLFGIEKAQEVRMPIKAKSVSETFSGQNVRCNPSGNSDAH